MFLLRFIEAAELFFASNQPDNAVKAFVLGGQWAKAKKVKQVGSVHRFHHLTLTVVMSRFS